MKTTIELLTAIAALCAAIASLVSAVKSSQAKDEAGTAKEVAQTIQTEIRTNIVASLNTVVRQTQAVQQTQHFNINVGVGTTEAHGLAANDNAPILVPAPVATAPVERGQPPEVRPNQEQEGR